MPVKTVGFANIHSTCYINTTIQCILQVPELLRYLEEHTFDDEFINSLRNIILFIKNSEKDKIVIRPMTFLKNFFVSFPQFHFGRQEDAHECLIAILDYIHEKTKLRNGNSIVKKLFYSTTQTSYTCSVCRHSSSITENHLCVTLETDNINTIFDPSKTSFDSTCSKCKRDTTRIRVQNTTVQPKYLIINNNLTKANISINFKETMNNYRMQSVIFHDGGLGSGHYYGCVLRSEKWYIVDDESSIQLNSFSDIQSKTPYVFIYQK